MITTPLLLLAVVTLQVTAYEIRIGSAATLLKNYHLNTTEDIQRNNQFVRRTHIFPYDVYERPTRESTAIEAKSFLFVKISYDLLAPSFELQNRSVTDVKEYQILYKRIPEIALIEGSANQYMEFIREDPSLYNPLFIIKNSTAQNRAEGAYTLTFWSLRVTKYLERIIKSSQTERRSALKKEEVTKILADNAHLTDELVDAEHRETELVLMRFFDNDAYYESLFAAQLFNAEMTRAITDETLWSAKYDGFSIYFASASCKEVTAPQQKQAQIDKYIDMFIIASRESEEKRVQHIKEPLSYLNLLGINHLQLCTSMQKLKLVIADRQSIYLIDVSSHVWNLDFYKTSETFDKLFFDRECRLFKTSNRTAHEVNGVKKIEFETPIRSVISLTNIVAFCLQADFCKVYTKSLQQEYLEIKLPKNALSIELQESLNINKTVIYHNVGHRIKWGSPQLYQQLSSFSIMQSSGGQNYSFFYEFLYPFDLYFKKSVLRQKEMDKMFYFHFSTLQNKHIYKLPQNYFEFSGKLTENNCSKNEESETEEFYSINGEENWNICTISLSTSGLLLFKIKTANVESSMYICESSLENYSSNQEINCQYYTAPANSEKSYYITNNKQIKFYILRVSNQKKFPSFFFTDIQRQQLAFASTVFFFLMLMLAICFFLIILFIVLRPLIIAMMIYFGWRQDLAVPSYPLGWLQLKIRIKRLVEMRFLRYVPHEPKNEGQDNHCCFCLENLMKGVKIAQLYCEHEFHKQCFNEWVKNEPNLRCPTCRREFSRQHLNDYLNSHQMAAV